MNVQGENVQKMDAIANRIMLYRMERCGALCAMSSEEEAELVRVSPEFPRGDYILIFDPLDGSSNIDVNINVGTIFSILRRPEGHTGEVTLEEVLQPGCQQVGAGYILYGPSTMLVLSTGQGVHGFTLDPGVGEFLLSHPNMRIPEQGRIYSVNEGNWKNWDEPTREVLQWFHNCETPDGTSYSARYVGALVADFHRTLIYGGIYLYPSDHKKPQGKLRLMCEANPLAFLAEQPEARPVTARGAFWKNSPTGCTRARRSSSVPPTTSPPWSASTPGTPRGSKGLSQGRQAPAQGRLVTPINWPVRCRLCRVLCAPAVELQKKA